MRLSRDPDGDARRDVAGDHGRGAWDGLGTSTPDLSPRLREPLSGVLRALLWTVDNDLQTEAPEVDALAGVGASPESSASRPSWPPGAPPRELADGQVVTVNGVAGRVEPR